VRYSRHCQAERLFSQFLSRLFLSDDGFSRAIRDHRSRSTARGRGIELGWRFYRCAHSVALACIERAGGNPLFLEQLLRNAEEGSEGAIPASMQSLVLARMDRLAQRDRQAFHAAAVIGQRFDLALLRHLIESMSASISIPYPFTKRCAPIVRTPSRPTLILPRTINVALRSRPNRAKPRLVLPTKQAKSAA
jgi:hypothetical protein